MWVKQLNTLTTEQPSNYYIKVKDLLYEQISNFSKLIFISLFLIFIENEVNLHTLEVTIVSGEDIEYFDDIFKLILQKPSF
ncbi:hypothetical protein GLOIN_2v1882637 [Rhizophagus clarus]|uniref:Uncharacterized protein n=1 Tax=Rhizophagus clarus TaxID=94130 RepID=A0A8H3L3G8_9GLOM|nr:hypothetical protein GLOIN_2v1882637 [Rhizophagus clarus]